MKLNLQTQQHIKFKTIERADAFIVFAILVETRGNEIVAISEPKIVRVIQKTQVKLTGTVSGSSFILPGLTAKAKRTAGVVSPYISAVFGTIYTKNITGIAPQPPTN